MQITANCDDAMKKAKGIILQQNRKVIFI